jgi:FkbM family methyltransferase
MNQFLSLIKRILLPLLPEKVAKQLRIWRAISSIESRSSADEDNLSAISRMISPGDTVVDVGANIGTYTFALSRMVGPAGKVISIEPIPSTFEVLSRVVKHFDLKNVELHNCAITESSGTVPMVVPRSASVPNFYRAQIVSGVSMEDSQVIEVAGRRLDDIVAGRSIKFIKIDVEGHELAVVRSGQTTIKASAPVALIEVDGDPRQSSTPANQLFVELKSKGYEPYFTSGRELVYWTGENLSVDYFFLGPVAERSPQKC